ncbi:hypothetical protein CN378_12970 [Bacillus sp. AFS015802]|uniref:hypothetical protein n=1 Tax=Bacillus sp. AFS015802 TaxID=2033486 RepID=UPI000BF33920|nr:hypothetical protein [Bacillus sp. AFS015802]PFA66804.1 hypothetical protein CN378_12970 [Bacillus sp. AFS015802]
MKSKQEYNKIKSSLDRDVFSKYSFQSQKKEILQKAERTKTSSNVKRYYHLGLTAMALILLSIVTISFIKSNPSEIAPIKQVDQPKEEKPVEPKVVVPEPAKKEDEVNEKVQEESEEEKSDVGNEETTPAFVLKSEEEWKEYFRGIYQEKSNDIKKLKLKYQIEEPLENTVSYQEIITDVKENHFIEVVNQKRIENGEIVSDGSAISTNNQHILLDHQRKNFLRESLEAKTFDEWKEYKALYSNHPLYYFSELELKGFEWREIDQNVDENWVVFDLYNRNATGLYSRGEIKVEYDSGVILKKTTYNNNQVSSVYTLKELKKNDELSAMSLNTEIPEGYVDRHLIEQSRVEIEEKSIDLAKEVTMKKHPNIESAYIVGEGFALSEVVVMKKGTTEEEAKAAAEELFNQFTSICNAQPAYKEKNKTVWDEGQYDIQIRVSITQKSSFVGSQENGILKWK